MKKIILVLCFLGICIGAFATQTITLTTSGCGPTDDDAIKLALRSAIEQTYGVFVSSNTTVINDEIGNDSIAIISKGVVQKYDIISRLILNDGSVFVTLIAVISPDAVVSYAINHNGGVSYDGNSFLMDLKIKQLRVENTKIALNNMFRHVYALLENAFMYSLDLGTPSLQETGQFIVPITVRAYANEVNEQISEIIESTLASLNLSDNEAQEFKDRNLPVYRYGNINGSNNLSKYEYCLPCDLNDYFNSFNKAVYEQFTGIRMVTKDKSNKYKVEWGQFSRGRRVQNGIPVFSVLDVISQFYYGVLYSQNNLRLVMTEKQLQSFGGFDVVRANGSSAYIPDDIFFYDTWGLSYNYKNQLDPRYNNIEIQYEDGTMHKDEYNRAEWCTYSYNGAEHIKFLNQRLVNVNVENESLSKIKVSLDLDYKYKSYVKDVVFVCTDNDEINSQIQRDRFDKFSCIIRRNTKNAINGKLTILLRIYRKSPNGKDCYGIIKDNIPISFPKIESYLSNYTASGSVAGVNGSVTLQNIEKVKSVSIAGVPIKKINGEQDFQIPRDKLTINQFGHAEAVMNIEIDDYLHEDYIIFDDTLPAIPVLHLASSNVEKINEYCYNVCCELSDNHAQDIILGATINLFHNEDVVSVTARLDENKVSAIVPLSGFNGDYKFQLELTTIFNNHYTFDIPNALTVTYYPEISKVKLVKATKEYIDLNLQIKNNNQYAVSWSFRRSQKGIPLEPEMEGYRLSIKVEDIVLSTGYILVNFYKEEGKLHCVEILEYSMKLGSPKSFIAKRLDSASRDEKIKGWF